MEPKIRDSCAAVKGQLEEERASFDRVLEPLKEDATLAQMTDDMLARIMDQFERLKNRRDILLSVFFDVFPILLMV